MSKADYLRLHNGMEAYRSAVDGMWRIWGKLPLKRLMPGSLEASQALPYFDKKEVILAAGPKLAEAHKEAKRLVRRRKKKGRKK